MINDLTSSISFLMERLEVYCSKQVMVFINEYDTPFIDAYTSHYYEEVNESLSVMLQSTLKSSSSLQYAMLTEIQRVTKENIFSGLNNPLVCTVHDEAYSDYFGFTIKETQALLKYYDLVNENSYHILLLGMCLILTNDYHIESNRKIGKGRCDIILKSKYNQPSFVIEFKYLKSYQENVNKELKQLAKEAIQQIVDKQYDASLTGKIIYIGLAHRGKDLAMEWIEK